MEMSKQHKWCLNCNKKRARPESSFCSQECCDEYYDSYVRFFKVR